MCNTSKTKDIFTNAWNSMVSPMSAMPAIVVGFEVVVGGGTSEKCIFSLLSFESFLSLSLL